MKCSCGVLLPFSYSKNDIFGRTACPACLALEQEEQWQRDRSHATEDASGPITIPASDFVSGA